MNMPISPYPNWKDTPIIAVDMPVMYEDEGQEEMGETDFHRRCNDILCYGSAAHLAGRGSYRVFSDLNIYYHPVDRWAYISPDVCAFLLERPLPEYVTSYRIGADGPAPLLAMEVISKRSAQQQDLTNKPHIYAEHGVDEYILVDVTGEFFAQRLLLKELQHEDGTWIDRQDSDGGVTSKLGFRIIIDEDGMVRMLDAKTGKRYIRPEEAQDEIDAQVDRIRQLEEELKRLRGE